MLFFGLDALGFDNSLWRAGIWVGDEIWEERMELREELMAGVFAADFVEPAWVWLRVLCSDNLDDIATLELGIEADHLAVDARASTGGADFAMEAIGKI